MDAGIVTTLIGTVAVGIALATLMIRLIRGLARNLEKQIDILRGDIRELRQDQTTLRDRVSRIEGLLEGLREAIAGRHAHAAAD